MKLDALLNHISNNLISCQTLIKMQLKMKYQLNTQSQLSILVPLPEAHDSVSVTVNFKSHPK